MVDLSGSHGLHLKPTAIVTNEQTMARALDRRCDGAHQHEQRCRFATKASDDHSKDMANLVVATLWPLLMGTTNHGGTGTRPEQGN